MFDFKNIITKNNCSNKLFKNKMLIAFLTNEICISLKNVTPQKKTCCTGSICLPFFYMDCFTLYTLHPLYLFLPLCSKQWSMFLYWCFSFTFTRNGGNRVWWVSRFIYLLCHKVEVVKPFFYLFCHGELLLSPLILFCVVEKCTLTVRYLLFIILFLYL